MHRSRLLVTKVAFAALVGASHAHAAGKLTVHDAWIRMPPPGSEMSAGYATLANTGDEPISVLTVQSNAYRMTSLHETVTSGDVSKMRELHRLKIAAGETIQMRPGGKHLMLMQPRRDIAVGEKVEIMFLLLDGTRVETYFDVVPADASGD